MLHTSRHHTGANQAHTMLPCQSPDTPRSLGSRHPNIDLGDASPRAPMAERWPSCSFLPTPRRPSKGSPPPPPPTHRMYSIDTFVHEASRIRAAVLAAVTFDDFEGKHPQAPRFVAHWRHVSILCVGSNFHGLVGCDAMRVRVRFLLLT